MRILFHGDSITDAGRVKENAAHLGRGYPHLIAASLGFDAPNQYQFINKGTNCNRIIDLYTHKDTEIIGPEPDVLSILIGVNDIWQHYAQTPNGTSPEEYFRLYDLLIAEVKAALPHIQIMILEPFLLPGTDTGDAKIYPGFRKMVEEIAGQAKAIAEKYGLVFVPLQAGFDVLQETAGNGYWLTDGVHPAPTGHEFIKRRWLEAFRTIQLKKE